MYLPKFEEEELLFLLKRIIDLFFRAPSYMPCINARVEFHGVAIDPTLKLVSQRKHKVNEGEKRGYWRGVKKAYKFQFHKNR